MDRITKLHNNKYEIEEEDYEKAINKLAHIENMLEDIANQKEKLSAELEILRSDNQMKSYKFRELMGRKLINSAIIDLLKSFKIVL